MREAIGERRARGERKGRRGDHASRAGRSVRHAATVSALASAEALGHHHQAGETPAPQGIRSTISIIIGIIITITIN